MSSFDIFDQHDAPTGKTASYEEVNTQGLWHRGVHVIIYTPEKQIVMQKRSINMNYHPSEIEISVGGGVDAGERPIEAIVREIKEETGICVGQDELKYIGKTKYNHHTKNQLSRTHIYSYSVCVDKSRLKFLRQEEEVESIFLISKAKLQRALAVHRIKNVGKISSLYAYWRMLLAAV